MIPFNKPYFTGKEAEYIYQAVQSGKISGDGMFSKKCHEFFEKKYGFKRSLLTTSCTDALEMAAILVNIQAGDEIIAPAFTFVSTVNAFVLRGAKIIFADSHASHPNIDAGSIERLITPRTKAIIPVHYAGVGCDMDTIMELAARYNLFVVEDAAQAIDSFYKGKALGSIGHLAAFSFHETKNIISGEGGLLAINDPVFLERAEIIREKGTNRSSFFRGEVDKYGWVDIGSSFLPSDIIAAFLFAQVENLENIQERRMEIWQNYYSELKVLEEKGLLKLPEIPGYSTNNAHMFYLCTDDGNTRTKLIEFLKKRGVQAVFHYQSLHKSPFYSGKYKGEELSNSDHFSECLLRLPFFYELSSENRHHITDSIKEFYIGRTGSKNLAQLRVSKT